MTVDFTYGTDLDNAKKMQGAERFGDFAIQLRTRIMTRPGEPYVIRRKVDAPLKKALAENGARFAFRTV